MAVGPMWRTEVRSAVVVALVVAIMVIAWNRIENYGDEEAAATAAEVTTTTSTTTTVATTTTLSSEERTDAICAASAQFAEEAFGLDPTEQVGEIAQMAAIYWSEVLELAPEDSRTDLQAVVRYYSAYLETAQPFEFDSSRIITEGDKERFELLVTQPATGLAAMRDLIAVVCGVGVPDQPYISPRSFERLEDRLLGNRRSGN